MTSKQWQAKMTPEQWQSLQVFFLPDETPEITPEDERKVKELRKKGGINESYFPVMLFLFIVHKDSILTDARNWFSITSFYRKLQQVTIEINKLEASAVKDKLLRVIAEEIPEPIKLPFYVKPLKDTGRQQTVDSITVEACANLAGYLWLHKLIPTKDDIYLFIYVFIKACGVTLNKGEKESISFIKDYLKKYLQYIDKS